MFCERTWRVRKSRQDGGRSKFPQKEFNNSVGDSTQKVVSMKGKVPSQFSKNSLRSFRLWKAHDPGNYLPEFLPYPWSSIYTSSICQSSIVVFSLRPMVTSENAEVASPRWPCVQRQRTKPWGKLACLQFALGIFTHDSNFSLMTETFSLNVFYFC